MNSPCPRKISPAGLLGDSEDLITEILLRLPAKHVVRLKLVSKRWLSLISDRNFILGHKATSGLILVDNDFSTPRYSYVSLDENERTTEAEYPTRYICSFDPHAPAPIKISDSCNGLLLCYAKATTDQAVPCRLYVVNPTTQQFTTLPLPPTPGRDWDNINLVYDPRKSPVYQVCSIMRTKSLCYIHIYSSDTGFWKLFGAYHLDLFLMGFNGVFCNGAIHWVCTNGSSYRLDFNQKSIKKLPKPPLPMYWNGVYDLKYFGESEGNLYFIVRDTRSTSAFIVYELHNDCSGWFAKYSLDVKAISSSAFPEINGHFEGLLPELLYQLQQLDMYGSVLSFVNFKNEGPALVTSIRGKIIYYSFKNNTFNELHDFHYRLETYKVFNFRGTWSCI